MELINLKAKEVSKTSRNTLDNCFTKFLRNLPIDLKCDITSPSCKGRINIQLSRLRTFSRSSHYVRVIYIQKPETSSIDVGNVCMYICLYVYVYVCMYVDRLCGLVVRVSGYRYRGLGFDSRRYQIF